jgi:hypothetical protein
MGNFSTIATLVIISGTISLLCLLLLHFVSSEFKPSFRMVSEYALGKHKWLITSFFVFWSISTVLAAYLYFNIVSTNWAVFGAILVFISGVGALMGGLFDVRHKLHGLSFALGVPTFPIGALIIAYHLGNQNSWLPYKSELLIAAHSVWISLVLMGVSMGLFFSSLQKSGIPFGPNEEPLTEIPKGVVGINGYANRLLVLVYVAFNLVISFIYLKI